MYNENTRPEMGIDCKDVPSVNNDERTDTERYRDLLLDALDICLEAQQHLHLIKSRPECALLILQDYLKEIEEACSI